jgi:UDP-N-acetylmuramoyl-L-alanyl-D-glutamate--2,6-diaminopimelate ligase
VPGYPRPRSVRSTPFAEMAASLRASRTLVPDGATPADITGVTLSSGSVLRGDLFCALNGTRVPKVHGVKYAPAAAAAGAVAILTDEEGAGAAAATGLPVIVVDDPREDAGPAAAIVYGKPTERLTVIGVTGTAGKTSTCYLIEAGLRAAGRNTGLIGTVETRMGDTVLPSERTTPEAPELQALFAVALEQGVDAVAMEVSSHALRLGRVNGVSFAVGGYTNFGMDHLDFHTDLEDYFSAKARLFDGRSRIEILNRDDEQVRRLIKPTAVTYSAAGDDRATYWAGEIRPHGYGQTFVVHGPDGLAVTAGVRLPGRHNVANALLAIAGLIAVGVDAGVAATAVAGSGGAPGRMERVDPPEVSEHRVMGIVDYAHKPDAIVEVLAALRQLAADQADTTGKGRVICVIGAGGDRDTGKRPVMGAAAAAGADLVIVTDDNPRTEDPAAIRRDVLAGVPGDAPAAVIEVEGRRAAIDEAVRRAEPGDIIAVLGKGHERGQQLADRTVPFDDRVELAAALRARFAPTAPTTPTPAALR